MKLVEVFDGYLAYYVGICKVPCHKLVSLCRTSRNAAAVRCKGSGSTCSDNDWLSHKEHFEGVPILLSPVGVGPEQLLLPDLSKITQWKTW